LPDSKTDNREQVRSLTADQVPFFLKAWWLKDQKSQADLVWPDQNWLTLPLFSLQTDPGCDAGGIDFDVP
jgi:hypothetical protein